MARPLASACLTALVFFNAALAAPFRRSISSPRLLTDFPDPALLHVGDTWYVFGTQSGIDNTNVHVQVAKSGDFNTWTLLEGVDALPTLPHWVDTSNPAIWAPDVVKVVSTQKQMTTIHTLTHCQSENQYVHYFSVTTNTAGDGAYHCVGTATSTSMTGPFIPNNEPFACPTDQGGAIDASGFVESDGTRYVVYKIDGNAKGHGGSCGNTVSPIVSTPILIQKVHSDGITKIGSATKILTNTVEDGPLVEAPSLIRHGSGSYILFYSSGCYVDSSYAAKYATSNSLTNEFKRGSETPLMSSGSYGLTGPGGLDASLDGLHVAFHGKSSANGGRRLLYTGLLSIDGTTINL